MAFNKKANTIGKPLILKTKNGNVEVTIPNVGINTKSVVDLFIDLGQGKGNDYLLGKENIGVKVNNLNFFVNLANQSITVDKTKLLNVVSDFVKNNVNIDLTSLKGVTKDVSKAISTAKDLINKGKTITQQVKSNVNKISAQLNGAITKAVGTVTGEVSKNITKAFDAVEGINSKIGNSLNSEINKALGNKVPKNYGIDNVLNKLTDSLESRVRRTVDNAVYKFTDNFVEKINYNSLQITKYIDSIDNYTGKIESTLDAGSNILDKISNFNLTEESSFLKNGLIENNTSVTDTVKSEEKKLDKINSYVSSVDNKGKIKSNTIKNKQVQESLSYLESKGIDEDKVVNPDGTISYKTKQMTEEETNAYYEAQAIQIGSAYTQDELDRMYKKAVASGTYAESVTVAQPASLASATPEAVERLENESKANIEEKQTKLEQGYPTQTTTTVVTSATTTVSQG